MRLNHARREITLKIVYYGPGLSGKTTNLAWLHQVYPQEQRGELVQFETETERTLFFDYFPVALAPVNGFRVRLDFFTVPGQSFYRATRQAVLNGADGIVFVADSSPAREDANLLSREDMVRTLAGRGTRLADVPHVYQWNKRDVAGAVPEARLERQLNPEGARSFCATAASGEGVWETQQGLIQEVLHAIRTRKAGAGAPRPADEPAAEVVRG